MKNKIYKSSSVLAAAIFLFSFACSLQSHAQVTVIYNQTFNSAYPDWPTGWSSSSVNGWLMDTSTANESYVPTTNMFGYPGASGGAMVDLSNPANGDTGTYSVKSSAISTIGYDNIAVIYGARRTKHFSDSGSVIKSFSWTSDGGTTWNPISYVENPNDSYWHLINDSVPMSLPVGAANQDSIRFRWMAFIHSNAGSGTYRFDDLTVAGTVTTGINTLNNLSSQTIFPNPASDFAIINNPQAKNYILRLVDVTGKVLKTIISSDVKSKIDLSGIDTGLYFVQITGDSDQQLQVLKLIVIK